MNMLPATTRPIPRRVRPPRKGTDPAEIERDNTRLLEEAVDQVRSLLSGMLEKREWGAIRLHLLVNAGEIVQTIEAKIRTNRKLRTGKGK